MEDQHCFLHSRSGCSRPCDRSRAELEQTTSNSEHTQQTTVDLQLTLHAQHNSAIGASGHVLGSACVLSRVVHFDVGELERSSRADAIEVTAVRDERSVLLPEDLNTEKADLMNTVCISFQLKKLLFSHVLREYLWLRSAERLALQHNSRCEVDCYFFRSLFDRRRHYNHHKKCHVYVMRVCDLVLSSVMPTLYLSR